MWIKFLLLGAIVLIAVALTRATLGARRVALRRLLLGVFVVGAALSVLFPNALTTLANAIGVGRGTDLLVYALVIAFLSYVATSYRRTSQLTRELTVVAREVALLRSELEFHDLHNSSTSHPQPLRQLGEEDQYDS